MDYYLVCSICGRSFIKFLISSWSDKEHGCHGCFFFSGWYIKNLLLWNWLAKWINIRYLWKVLYIVPHFLLIKTKHGHHWWFLFLIGGIIKNLIWNFLTKCQVSNTGSASRASSFLSLTVLKVNWVKIGETSTKVAPRFLIYYWGQRVRRGNFAGDEKF